MVTVSPWTDSTWGTSLPGKDSVSMAYNSSTVSALTNSSRDATIPSGRERSEDRNGAKRPQHRDPRGIAVRMAEHQTSDGVGGLSHGLVVGEWSEPPRHRLHLYEDRRGEGEGEDQRKRHHLGGLGVRRREPDVREAPRQAVGEQQHEKACLHDGHDAAVGTKPHHQTDTRDDDDDQHVAREVRDGSSTEYRHARHGQRPESLNQATLQVLGEADRRTDRTEDGGLDENPRDEVVDVVETGNVDLNYVNYRSAEHT